MDDTMTRRGRIGKGEHVGGYVGYDNIPEACCVPYMQPMRKQDV